MAAHLHIVVVGDRSPLDTDIDLDKVVHCSMPVVAAAEVVAPDYIQVLADTVLVLYVAQTLPAVDVVVDTGDLHTVA